jgi:hypothetical protein
MEGRALLVGRTDKRLGYRDFSDWVVGGEDRKKRLEEFNRLMRFCLHMPEVGRYREVDLVSHVIV